ncbi:MAG: hypothetical protein HQK55_05340 [Deltaproteobacteria bacterium]|nr:hypothetical protein [Deltaproteobacteria bacterium]
MADLEPGIISDGLEDPKQVKSRIEALNQQINTDQHHIKELERLESEVSAARAEQTPEMKKLANRIANRRVLLGEDMVLRQRLRDKLKAKMPYGPEAQAKRVEEIKQLKEEVNQLQKEWPKLSSDKGVMEPCYPCLAAELDQLKQDWRAAYPQPSAQSKKVADDVARTLTEMSQEAQGPTKAILDKPGAIGVLEHPDGSCTVAFSGQPTPESLAMMKDLQTKFKNQPVKFLEFNPETLDPSKHPNLIPTRERDEINIPEGADIHPSRGRYCCERKLFSGARQTGKPVSGMYIRYYPGASKSPNPFPADSEAAGGDPALMAPCPSCKINHARITQGVTIL